MTDFTTSPTDDGGAITPPRALDADGDGRPDYTVETVLVEEAVPTALQRIPRGVRIALYAAYAIAGPLLAHLAAKGYIGADELTLYATLGPVLGITAAGNVTR